MRGECALTARLGQADGRAYRGRPLRENTDGDDQGDDQGQGDKGTILTIGLRAGQEVHLALVGAEDFVAELLVVGG